MTKPTSKVGAAWSFCAMLASLCACRQAQGSGRDIAQSIKKAGQRGLPGG